MHLTLMSNQVWKQLLLVTDGKFTLSRNDKDFTEVDVPLESREDMHLRGGGLPGWPGFKLGRSRTTA